MNGKKKIAFGLCVFLTLTPFIGSYISQESTLGEYVGNFTPYIHFTMPETGGSAFAEAVGVLIAICIFLVGLIGLIIFSVTNFRKVSALLFLLYMTALYCGLRVLGGLAFNMPVINRLDTKARIIFIAGIISDL